MNPRTGPESITLPDQFVDVTSLKLVRATSVPAPKTSLSADEFCKRCDSPAIASAAPSGLRFVRQWIFSNLTNMFDLVVQTLSDVKWLTHCLSVASPLAICGWNTNTSQHVLPHCPGDFVLEHPSSGTTNKTLQKNAPFSRGPGHI